MAKNQDLQVTVEQQLNSRVCEHFQEKFEAKSNPRHTSALVLRTTLFRCMSKDIGSKGRSLRRGRFNCQWGSTVLFWL
jgi:hypothetical protein